MIILGKHSGRHALKDRAAKYGIALDAAELDALYESFKETADRQKAVSDDELLRMVSTATGQQAQVYELGDVQVLAGSAPRRLAAVTVRHLQNGTEESYTSTGNGPLEAVIAAISQGIAEQISFAGLELHSLGSGENAQAEAAVMVEWEGGKFRGTAIHQDIVMAAGIAYIAACNAALLSAQVAQVQEEAFQPIE
ncbi:2-isopropylmalate synthase [compost metagenome]